MGTRAIIHVKYGKKTFISIYNMFDGYMGGNGVGSVISKLLQRKNTNGVMNGTEFTSYAGPGNFTSLLMFELGRVTYDPKYDDFEAGYCYVVPEEYADYADYVYTIKFSKKDEFANPKIKVDGFDINTGWLSVEEYVKLNNKQN